MKSTLSLAVVALLYGAEAVQFRPYTDGRTPWYKKASRPNPTPFPHNYPVPNFGSDTDMAATAKNIAVAEKKYKIKYDPKRKHGPPEAAKVDYKVPNFGVDSDVIVTQRNIADTEKELGKKMKATFKQPAGPPNYKVPNFGQDTDVKDTLANIRTAEKQYKIKYNPEKKTGPPEAAAVNYKVPNFGVDADIIATSKSLKQAESQAAASKKPAAKRPAKNTGKLSQIEEQNMALSLAASQAQPDTYDELAQIDISDDPICGSGGCDQYKHKKAPLGYPIDYPVPSFGPDPDIEANHRSLSIAEAMHSHKLIMGTPESKAKWHNVAKDTMYDFAPALDKDIADTQAHIPIAEGIRQHKWNIGFAQTGEDMSLRDDPICGSGGCDQYKHKKAPLGYPIDYPVPSFGPDPDIEANHRSLSIAEAMHSHKLIMGTPESKAKWHNVAKDTMYDFAPALDKDIADTQAHIPIAEGIRQHKWTIA